MKYDQEVYEALAENERSKPVAWYNADDSSLSFKNHGGGWQPLYTHLVQKPMMVLDGNRVYPAFKELTDEEINSIYEESYLPSGLDEWEFDAVYFARAILRKAHEK